MISVLLIAAISKERQIYRKIGYAEVLEDIHFDEDFVVITFIQVCKASMHCFAKAGINEFGGEEVVGERCEQDV